MDNINELALRLKHGSPRKHAYNASPFFTSVVLRPLGCISEGKPSFDEARGATVDTSLTFSTERLFDICFCVNQYVVITQSTKLLHELEGCVHNNLEWSQSVGLELCCHTLLHNRDEGKMVSVVTTFWRWSLFQFCSVFLRTNKPWKSSNWSFQLDLPDCIISTQH